MEWRRLSLADRSNLAIESIDTPMHVAGIAIIEGDLDEATVLDGVERGLSRVPQLRQRLWHPGLLRGGPVWIDDEGFSLRRHVRWRTLPPGSDEKVLLEAAAEVLQPLLERDHPLWELWLLTGLAAGRSALLLKIHHAVADGLAIVALVSSLFAPEMDTDRTPASWRPSPRPQALELLVDAWLGRLRTARHGLGHPLKGMRRVSSVVGDLKQVGRRPHAARISINRPVRAGRSYRRQVFNLDELKTVAHRHGGKVNDLVLLLAGAGLRELLTSRGELAADTVLQASVPVGQRDTGDFRLGNAAGIMRIAIAVGDPDPNVRLDRLIAVTSEAKRVQHPNEGIALIAWLGILGLIRPFIKRQRLVNLHTSNIPGPSSPMQVFGARVVDAFPLTVLAGNTPVSFVAFSYAGGLSLVTLLDPSSVPEIDLIQRGITDAWELLRPAAAEPTGPDTVHRTALARGSTRGDAESGRQGPCRSSA